MFRPALASSLALLVVMTAALLSAAPKRRVPSDRGGGGGASVGNFSFSGDGVDLSGSAAMSIGGANTTTVGLLSGDATGGTMATIDSTTAWSTGVLLDMKTHHVSVAKLSIFDNANGFELRGPSTARLTVDGSGLMLGNASTNFGVSWNLPGKIEVVLGGGLVYAFKDTAIYPLSDASSTLGDDDKRFDAALVGSSASEGTCDVHRRGKFKTQFAASLSPDTFDVCMKKSDDSYAWVTIGTAP